MISEGKADVKVSSDFIWYESCFDRLQSIGIESLVEWERKLMTDRGTQEGAERDPGNMIKDPDSWTTGDEPMTGAQRSYLHTLAEEAGVEVKDELTKAEASKEIDALQEKTGRGR